MSAKTEPVAAPIGVTLTKLGNLKDVDLEIDIEKERIDTDSIHTSSTGSLAESIKEYREIHGRTYTQKSEYWGPNDDKQNDALDFNHYWQTDFFDGKLFLAPIGDNPERVLDLGTGTGIWAIDFADKYLDADIIGTDLSPTQPSWVPPNVKFLIDDFEQEWTWPKDHFDFVHARNLEGCFKDLPGFFKQLYDHTKPGGWFEVKEFEGQARSQTREFDKDHIFERWWRLASEAQAILGKPTNNALERRYAKGLAEAGFVDIVEKKWKIPIGTWPARKDLKKLGACNLEFVEQSLEGFMLMLLNEVLGYTIEQTRATIEEMRAAVRDNKNTPYYYMHLVYARKPLDGEIQQA